MASLFAFPRAWSLGGDVEAETSESSPNLATNLKDRFRHSRARETNGTTGKGWKFDFDNVSTNVAGIVLLDWEVDQDTGTTPRLKLQLSSADPFAAVVYSTGNTAILTRDLWPDPLFYSSNPVNEWNWIVDVDTVQSGESDNSTGSPATSACKSGKLTFESQTSPNGFWEASMLVVLVDPVTITSQTTLGSPDLSGRQRLAPILAGHGSEWSWKWGPVDQVVADSLMQIYQTAEDGPLYVLPDTGAAKQQASPNAFLTGQSMDRRGGLVKFAAPPEATRDKRDTDLWSVTARFRTWGLPARTVRR